MTDEFFSFGLPNLYVPLNETERGTASISLRLDATYTHRPFSPDKPWDITITAMDRPDPLQKALGKLKSYENILFSTLHVTADRVFRNKGNRGIMANLGMITSKSSSAPAGRSELYNMVDVYYNRCIRSLFHPSPRMELLLAKYEAMLGEGVRIGVHIRMGKGMSDWKDSHTFLSHVQIVSLIDRLKTMVHSINARYPGLSVKIFLSTDSTKEEKIMRKALGDLIVTTEGLRSHVGGIFYTKFDDTSIQKAVLDQMLLGRCDFLFLTMKSGFSRIGLYYAPEGTPYKYIFAVCLYI